MRASSPHRGTHPTHRPRPTMRDLDTPTGPAGRAAVPESPARLLPGLRALLPAWLGRAAAWADTTGGRNPCCPQGVWGPVQLPFPQALLAPLP